MHHFLDHTCFFSYLNSFTISNTTLLWTNPKYTSSSTIYRSLHLPFHEDVRFFFFLKTCCRQETFTKWNTFALAEQVKIKFTTISTFALTWVLSLWVGHFRCIVSPHLHKNAETWHDHLDLCQPEDQSAK